MVGTDGVILVVMGISSLVVSAVATSFPRPHSIFAASTFGRHRFDMMVLLPPCMFLTVALGQWPLAGLEQVAAVWVWLNPRP